MAAESSQTPKGEARSENGGQEEYFCPMHPEVMQEEPGTCPKCGMELEPRGGAKKEDTTGPLEHNMFQMGHRMSAWVQGPLLLLGAWLVASPSTLGYQSGPMTVSDIASGLAIILLASLGLHQKRYWADLANVAVGIWLLFAPLVFWAPTAAEYANGTVVGALLIGFALLIPMLMPMKGADVPPGWSYNPSTWMQRVPIIALGFASFLIARYMAAFQLGHLDSVWDPFFGQGTAEILHSDVSKAWPISDAGLGAFVYLIEVLSTLMGDRRRWRTMPWMVAIFGLAVVPLGIVSIVLVMLQPVAVGTWCTLCLLSAVFMLLMIPLSLDEVFAMLQFLVRSRRAGQPLVRTFFLGGTVAGATSSERTRPDFGEKISMVWGVTPAWHLLTASVIGVGMMAAPGILGSSGAASNWGVILGGIVVTVAIVATADVTRVVQLLNVPFGLAGALLPWISAGASGQHRVFALLAGALVALLSLRRFDLRESYGEWKRNILLLTSDTEAGLSRR